MMMIKLENLLSCINDHYKLPTMYVGLAQQIFAMMIRVASSVLSIKILFLVFLSFCI